MLSESRFLKKYLSEMPSFSYIILPFNFNSKSSVSQLIRWSIGVSGLGHSIRNRTVGYNQRAHPNVDDILCDQNILFNSLHVFPISHISRSDNIPNTSPTPAVHRIPVLCNHGEGLAANATVQDQGQVPVQCRFARPRGGGVSWKSQNSGGGVFLKFSISGGVFWLYPPLVDPRL